MFSAATAQLISLLHHAPPVEVKGTQTTASRSRRHDNDEDEEWGEGREAEWEEEKDVEIMTGKGWWALGTSFIASGSLTVS